METPIKPCPFCGEGVMGDDYPCWKYRILHKEDCAIRILYGKHTYLQSDDFKRSWNRRV
jgi:hypothetical protein